MYVLYEFAGTYQGPIFKEEVSKSDSALDATFQSAYAMFRGKNTPFDQRMARLRTEVVGPLLSYYNLWKLSPVITSGVQYLHPYATPSDLVNVAKLGPQLPQEVWLLM
jgi:hypothetical protein